MHVSQLLSQTSSIPGASLPALFVLIAVLSIILALWNPSKSRHSAPIINENGKALPHADEDTRFSRFSHGKELGDKLIKTLGPIYTFQSGNIRELWVLDYILPEMAMLIVTFYSKF